VKNYYLSKDLIQFLLIYKAKKHHNIWTKVGNSGHSDVAWFFFISHKKMARLAGQSTLPPNR
jgi:hypothetical protein